MTEPIDLEPIRARLAAATPGPWESGRFIDGLLGVTAHEGLFRLAWIDGSRDEDAAFIANAPSDVAALVEEVERLRDAVDDALVIAHGNVVGSQYSPGLSEIIDRLNRTSDGD